MTQGTVAHTHAEVLIGLNALVLYQNGELGSDAAADCLARSRDALEAALAACRSEPEVENGCA